MILILLSLILAGCANTGTVTLPDGQTVKVEQSGPGTISIESPEGWKVSQDSKRVPLIGQLPALKYEGD